MNHRRTARAIVLTLALGLIDTGTAHAAPPANAAFIRPGAAVYAEDAVGIGCRTFGFCSGAAAELATTATPRYLSTRADEPVLVTCRVADLAKVAGFFGRGEDLVTGWANTNTLRIRDDDVTACGPLG